jgi:RecA DNA recombination protein
MITAPATHFDDIVADIQRRWGPKAMFRLAEMPERVFISTGVPSLDQALGGQGLPCGYITLLRGESTSGATTLAYRVMASAQKLNHVAVYLDCPGTFDAEAAVCGCSVNQAELLLVRPSDLMNALSIYRHLIQLPYRGLVVLDAGLLTATDLEQAYYLMLELQQTRTRLHQSGWTLLVILPTDLLRSLHRLAGIEMILKRRQWRESRYFVGYQALVTVTRHALQPAGQKAVIDVLVEL